MSRIFISYRRADSRLVANRIYDRLAQSLGKKNIFKDVDNIPPGKDFRGVLREATANCDVMLVIIGPDWISIKDDKGQRRLDNPDDFVRLEVEAGLQRNETLVIPVLVENAQMPTATNLPESLKELAYNNAFTINDDPYFHRDLDSLIAHLRKHVKYRGSTSFDWRWIVGVILIPIIAAIVGGLIENPSILGISQNASTPSLTDEASEIAEISPTLEMANADFSPTHTLTSTVQVIRELDTTATEVALQRTAYALETRNAELFLTMTPTRESENNTLISTPTTAILCPGAPPTRLVVGMMAEVVGSGTSRIRNDPSISSAVIGRVNVGETIEVNEGPICGQGYSWYRISTDSVVGWTVEGMLQGTREEYWLEPIAED
jgi:hypothetical protein